MLVIFIVETRRFRSEENCLGVRDERKERDVIVEEDWTQGKERDVIAAGMVAGICDAVAAKRHGECGGKL